MKRRRDDLRPTAGTNLVLLEPDVARIFPDSNSVNRALRLLRDVATRSSRRTRPTPNGRRREGSRDAEGRARLIALLKSIENSEERERIEGRAWFDVANLKSELGVDY